jgi:hypothetical protein
VLADVGAGLALHRPDDGRFYDDSAQFNGRVRFWMSDFWAVGLVGERGTWRVNDGGVRRIAGAPRLDVRGDVDLTAAGVSLFIRPIGVGGLALTFEGGARLVLPDADVRLREPAPEGNSIFLRNEARLDIDPGLVGVLGAELEVPILPRLALTFGAGLQADLVRGSVKADRTAVRFPDHRLASRWVRLGLRLAF